MSVPTPNVKKRKKETDEKFEARKAKVLADHAAAIILHEKADQIAKVFKDWCSVEVGKGPKGADLFVLSNNPVVNLPKLLKVAEILEATPEQLMFSADKRSSGYCPTCCSEWDVLVFWKEA